MSNIKKLLIVILLIVLTGCGKEDYSKLKISDQDGVTLSLSQLDEIYDYSISCNDGGLFSKHVWTNEYTLEENEDHTFSLAVTVGTDYAKFLCKSVVVSKTQ